MHYFIQVKNHAHETINQSRPSRAKKIKRHRTEESETKLKGTESMEKRATNSKEALDLNMQRRALGKQKPREGKRSGASWRFVEREKWSERGEMRDDQFCNWDLPRRPRDFRLLKFHCVCSRVPGSFSLREKSFPHFLLFALVCTR